MTVKRKDFQKTAAYIHQFLLKLDETPECAELRDALNLALLHMQKYFRWHQRRRDSECRGDQRDQRSLSNASLRGLSPMTPFVESLDKMHWRWTELDAAGRGGAGAAAASAKSSPHELLAPTTPLPAVLAACKAGDLGCLRELHRANSSCIEDTDCLGRTPLMYAAHYGQSLAAEWLLRSGADPNVPAHDQSTALHVAVRTGNWRLTELLLHQGADPNVQDAHGRAPVHWSVTTGTTECLKILLRRGADPSARDSDAASASMWACRLDSADHFGVLRRALAGHGDAATAAADLERDTQGRTVVHWAVRRQEPLVCLRALISKEAGALRDNSGKTPMLTAAEIGSMPACKLILEACGKEAADEADGDARAAVHLATLAGHGEVLNFLLDQGAEIDSRDKDGATAWDYAKQRRLNYCKLILASHYRQRGRDQDHPGAAGQGSSLQQQQQEAGLMRLAGGGAEFPIPPRPPQTPPTPRSKSPSSSGRRRLKVVGADGGGGGGGGGGGISRESSLETGELALAPAAEATEDATRRQRVDEAPVDGAERHPADSIHPKRDLPVSDDPADVLPAEAAAASGSDGQPRPRPPPGSPERRLIRAQAPYKLPHRRPASDDEGEGEDPADAALPPPPPEFQESGGDGNGNDGEGDDSWAADSGGRSPLDTARDANPPAAQPSSQPERHRRRRQQPETPPAQLLPLPAAYKEAATTTAAAAASAGRRRVGKKKRRTQSGGAAAGANAAIVGDGSNNGFSFFGYPSGAGLVQPLDSSSSVSANRQQMPPPPQPVAVPRSGSVGARSLPQPQPPQPPPPPHGFGEIRDYERPGQQSGPNVANQPSRVGSRKSSNSGSTRQRPAGVIRLVEPAVATQPLPRSLSGGGQN